MGKIMFKVCENRALAGSGPGSPFTARDVARAVYIMWTSICSTDNEAQLRKAAIDEEMVRHQLKAEHGVDPQDGAYPGPGDGDDGAADSDGFDMSPTKDEVAQAAKAVMAQIDAYNTSQAEAAKAAKAAKAARAAKAAKAAPASVSTSSGEPAAETTRCGAPQHEQKPAPVAGSDGGEVAHADMAPMEPKVLFRGSNENSSHE